MADISNGTKHANLYLRSCGYKAEFHDGASIANIVFGYDPNRFMETCTKEVRNYTTRTAGFKLTEEQIVELIGVTKAAL